MSGFTVNVREHQLSRDGQELRIHTANYARSLRLIGRVVVLYKPRDEESPGYYGVCLLANVERDFSHPGWIWLGLGPITRFPRPVSLADLYGGEGTNDTPFHIYSRTLRPISDYEFDQLVGREDIQESVGFYEQAWSGRPTDADAANREWTTRKVLTRQRMLRDELLRAYGCSCILSQKLHHSLSGHFYETQVGHLIALEYGGLDIIQNALPMSATTNWHWDHGLISLTNGGRILVSSAASSDTKQQFMAGRKISFPDPRIWPKAEFLEWHREHIFEKGRQPGLRWQIGKG